MQVFSGDGVLPQGGHITQIQLTSGEEYDKAIKFLGVDTDQIRTFVYDFNLVDSAGTSIHQLNGMIQVAFPAPFVPTPGRTISVYRLDGDKLTKVPCDYRTDGNAIVFVTDHFSTFVFVEENGTSAVKSPKTVEFPKAVILLAIAAVGVTSVFVLRKRA